MTWQEAPSVFGGAITCQSIREQGDGHQFAPAGRRADRNASGHSQGGSARLLNYLGVFDSATLPNQTTA